MPSAIELTDVSKRYGLAVVLDRVSATVPTGQVVGLLGHNGAGKTTLIKLALGLIRPTAGQVWTLGLRADGPNARQLHARVGYLPEYVAFYGNLTGHEVIDYLAELKHVARAEGPALLRRMGLDGASDRRVGTYSKGMRQRLGLAQALLGSPDLLLLDEPTTGLDPLVTQHFFELVGELRTQGKTVIISSHLLAELEPHLDRAVILRQGRVVAQGTVAEMHAAADLPITICARLDGAVGGLLHERWLTDLPAPPRVREATVLELDVPAGRKMEVLRHLMDLASLTDIAVKEPTLARLYATIGADAPPPDKEKHGQYRGRSL